MEKLSKRIKEGTKKSHTMAENTGFVSCFLKGVVEPESYRKLISDFYYVYSAMEEQFEVHKNHPVLEKIYFPELFRTESLEKDLQYFYGDNWKETISPTKSCQEYVDRIKKVSQEDAILLISHHYTRYIGDLSGGQILKKIAKTALNVGDEALNFYNFIEISDEKEFKQNYRSVLDCYEFTEEEIEKIISEANNAFRLNMKVFQELEGNLIASIGKILFSFLTKNKSKGSTENG